MKRLIIDCRFRYPTGFEFAADFEIGPGITTVVGPSGGGKSTLLSLIAGLLVPQSGTIRFGDRLLSTVDHLVSPHRRNVGVAFQDPRLFPHLSVERNLLYGRKRFRSVRPPFDEIVAALELDGLLDRRPESLSGGQRQRVSLGRAMLTGAELLLLDEPVSAIDPELRHRVLGYLRERVTADEQTCLVVTHDTATADFVIPAAMIEVVGGHTTLTASPAATFSTGNSVAGTSVAPNRSSH